MPSSKSVIKSQFENSAENPKNVNKDKKKIIQMPLVTLDPNKNNNSRPLPSSVTTSPTKRATPPQSPPTPHKIELLEDVEGHRRKLRSSDSSSASSTSSDEGLRLLRTSSVKKQLFQNGNVVKESVVIKAVASAALPRTSPRKITNEVTNGVAASIEAVSSSPGKDKGPKKKLSFLDDGESKNGSVNSVKAFMPIRRSERRPKKKVQTSDIIQRLKEVGTEDAKLPLEVVDIPGKNRGVVPTKKLSKGDFVVEYAGELIEQTTAEERENKYAMDISKGCYMYYFKANGKSYCIDATVETGRIGRLVNHSRLTPNLITKVFMLGKTPRLVLMAKTDIEPGTELLYDYGDRSKESLAAHPWLAK